MVEPDVPAEMVGDGTRDRSTVAGSTARLSSGAAWRYVDNTSVSTETDDRGCMSAEKKTVVAA